MVYRVLWEELRLYTGAILGARLFCWGIVFWLGFGQRTPRGFSLGSFWGSGVSSLLLSLPPFSSSFSSGGRPGCPFLLFACRQDSGLPVPGQAGASHTCSLSFLSPLSARVGRRTPSLLPPSALSLSLSLSSLSLLRALLS